MPGGIGGYKIPGISPEGHAIEFLRESGVSPIPPIDPYNICSKCDIQITVEPLEGVEAVLLRVGSSALIIINSNSRYRSRDVFSVAHELGHYYLPGHDKEKYYCTFENIYRFHGSQNNEQEANSFAAELLMPTPWLKKRIRTSDVTIPLIKQISEECHTSLTATAIKVSRVCTDRIVVVYSEHGVTKWTAKAKSFPYEIMTGKVNKGSPLMEYYETGNLPESPVQIHSYVWTASSDPQPFFLEQSTPMPYLGAALTVLTAFVDEDDDAWLDDDE